MEQKNAMRNLKLSIMVVLCLFAFMSFIYTRDVQRYKGYSGETMALIYDVRMRGENTGTNLKDCKLFYKYIVDGTTYGGESSWIAHLPVIYEGQEMKVRYDKDDHGSSILEVDNAHASAGLWALVFYALTSVMFIALAMPKKDKKGDRSDGNCDNRYDELR